MIVEGRQRISVSIPCYSSFADISGISDFLYCEAIDPLQGTHYAGSHGEVNMLTDKEQFCQIGVHIKRKPPIRYRVKSR
jgi:hypothetical protein